MVVVSASDLPGLGADFAAPASRLHMLTASRKEWNFVVVSFIVVGCCMTHWSPGCARATYKCELRTFSALVSTGCKQSIACALCCRPSVSSLCPSKTGSDAYCELACRCLSSCCLALSRACCPGVATTGGSWFTCRSRPSVPTQQQARLWSALNLICHAIGFDRIDGAESM